ncbi:hypothetical protein MKZ38_003315 [Zalerion maritima]|uniref:Uncharacterized protein n=1 Tax=Zalerion maritima TaxID=339359 RepID=A0AAD5WRV6_9PEZI|nr:hypothetical protein MKZ38_003315 [Zalerion maritima]
MCLLASASSRSNSKRRSSMVQEFSYKHRSSHCRNGGHGNGRHRRLHISGDMDLVPDIAPVFLPADIVDGQVVPFHHGQRFHLQQPQPMNSPNMCRRGFNMHGADPAPLMLPMKSDGEVRALKQSMKDQLTAHRSAVGKQFAAKLKETNENLSGSAKDISEMVDAVTKDVAAIKAAQEAEIKLRKDRELAAERAAAVANAREEGRSEERKKIEAARAKERHKYFMWEHQNRVEDRVWPRDRFRRVRVRSPDSIDTNSSDSGYSEETINLPRGLLGERCPTNNPMCPGICAHHPELRAQQAEQVVGSH